MLSYKTSTIVDLEQQLLKAKQSYQNVIWEMKLEKANSITAALTLTETSQLDNTGNKNNE